MTTPNKPEHQDVPENPKLPDPEKEGHKYFKTEPIFAVKMDKPFEVSTLEGDVEGKAGDYLCKGANGEYWPIDAEVFGKTYRQEEESPRYDPAFAARMAAMTPEDKAKSVAELEKMVSNLAAANFKGEKPPYISPAEEERDLEAAEEDTEVATEGIAPLSHDSSPERAIRKHKTLRSKRHMQGSDRYRRKDPIKKVHARLKRASRHQPRPEVAEALNVILKFTGKPISESDLDGIQNKQLFTDSIEFLAAMANGDWERTDSGLSNGHYVIESEDMTAVNGRLHFKGQLLQLNWDWLYETRELLRKKNARDGQAFAESFEPE